MAAIRTLEEISERLLRLRSSANAVEGFLDFFSAGIPTRRAPSTIYRDVREE